MSMCTNLHIDEVIKNYNLKYNKQITCIDIDKFIKLSFWAKEEITELGNIFIELSDENTVYGRYISLEDFEGCINE